MQRSLFHAGKCEPWRGALSCLRVATSRATTRQLDVKKFGAAGTSFRVMGCSALLSNAQQYGYVVVHE